MKRTDIIVLTADAGKWLWKEEVDSEGNVTRNFVRGIHNADVDQWQECTNEEKEQWEKENLPKFPETETTETESVEEAEVVE